ncbi:MAG TPA: serine/threonine-protein kinase [Polyangiales bacterium]|nr:serine/threonine-protein kinase [Polyangiales bacterium]
MSEGTPPSHSGSGAVAPVATLPVLEESPPEVVPALGVVIADKYRIEELIARGGMGAVYMATHLVTEKRVALKWMLPTLGQVPGAKERFVQEARATARIEHPNVIDIYDVGSDRGSVYLVMELLRGETLAEYLQRTPQVEPEEAVTLIMPALRGVAAAHSHHVIHRDLKPDNIFLCRSADGEPREPRVLDFGISKITSTEGPRNLALTSSGAVMGTPYYMSPEQVRGAKDVDERGDVYAFGVILYEMLSGQRPFDAETYNQLILKIATENPEPLLEIKPRLDRRLAAVVEKAMAREPSARFASIEELAVALEPFAAGMLFRASTLRTYTPTSNSGERLSLRMPSLRPRRSRPFIALGIVLGCAAAAIGFWALARSRPAKVIAAEKSVITAPEAKLEAPAPVTDTSAAKNPVAAPEPAPAAIVAPTPAAEPAPRAARREGKTERKAKPGLQPIAAQPTDPATGKLPADWDDRISIPTRPAPQVNMPAGPIDARDLR